MISAVYKRKAQEKKRLLRIAFIFFDEFFD